MVNFRRFLPGAAALVLCALPVHATSGPEPALNAEALNFARRLIGQGHFVADTTGAWANHRATHSQENEFIRDHGVSEYAKWHLAIDQRHGADTKTRYKFPFGDFQNVHRCGLLAIKSRAHQYGYQEIENAATTLLAMVESARPVRQKRVD